MGSTLKQILLKNNNPIEKVGKMKKAELFPLKVFPFVLNILKY